MFIVGQHIAVIVHNVETLPLPREDKESQTGYDELSEYQPGQVV